MLNQYFNRKEFKCKCTNCSNDTVDYELIQVLTRLREHFKQPMIITSGMRCPTHNKNSGGATNSSHLSGKAADFYVKNVPLDKVHQTLLDWYPDKYGIAIGKSFVHLDVRSTKARWVY